MYFNEHRLTRLCDAIRASDEELRVFRANRSNALRELVGFHYGSNGADRRVPINGIELATTIYELFLVADHPGVQCSTPNRTLKPWAKRAQLGMNRALQLLRLKNVARRVARAAILGLGIGKLGRGDDMVVEVDGEQKTWGHPFIEAVDLDDLILDTSARNWDTEIGFIGNRFRMPIDIARNYTGFNENARSRLVSDTDWMRRQHDAAEDIYGGGKRGMNTEFIERVELMDVYIPCDGVIVTLPANGYYGEPLAVDEIDRERPTGPYLPLYFTPVDNNILPLPPVATWMDMHQLNSALWWKAGQQALDQKNLITYRAGAQEDAERIRNAGDSMTIRVDAPQDVNVQTFGGPDPRLIALAIQGVDQFSRFAGNLDALGGLSSQSDTVGQERLLVAGSARRLEKMQGAVLDWVNDCVSWLFNQYWKDPYVGIPYTRRVGRIDIPRTWTAADHVGRPEDYNISVNAYSLQPRTPGQKLQVIRELMQTMIQPYMQSFEAQGISLDYKAYVTAIGEMAGVDDVFADFFAFDNSIAEAAARRDQQKPAHTTRTNTRISRSGSSQPARDGAMVRAMMSGGESVEPATMARIAGAAS